MRILPQLAGSNTGKSGSGSVRSAQEAPDSLQSKAYARIVDLVCEGPIEGFVNPSGTICRDCQLEYQPAIVSGGLAFPSDQFVIDANGIAYLKKRADGSTTALFKPGSSGYPLPRSAHVPLNNATLTPRILASVSGDGTGAVIEVLIKTVEQSTVGEVYGLRVVTPGSGYTKATVKVPSSVGQGIYFDDLALQRSDTLEFNFKSVRLEYRLGEFGQDPLPGFEFVEEVVPSSEKWPIEKKDSVAPNPSHRFTLLNKSYDRVVIDVELREGFYLQNTTNGDIEAVGSSDAVQVEITQQYKGSNDTEYRSEIAFGERIYALKGKTMSSYVRSIEGALFKDKNSLVHSWKINIRRISKDDSEHTNPSSRHTKFGVARLTGITDVKLRYPYCVLVGIEIDAEQFGKIPTRSYDVKLMLLKVPTNYFAPGTVRPDGSIRQFSEYNRSPDGTAVFNDTGKLVEQTWNGEFYTAWTNNPAWVFYSICTDTRFGLGNYLLGCNKWNLYKIGRYCDEPVYTGYLNGGFAFPEARFTCNLYVQASEEAYKFLTDLASCFRAYIFWRSGAIHVTQDSPAPVELIFSNANIDASPNQAGFSYVGTSRRARHTVATVWFNDPEDSFRLKPVIVEDYQGILRLGRRPIEVTAFACTSRGQARRFARWILQSELSNTDAEKHQTGNLGIAMRPGMIYGVLDPTRSAVQFAGRISALSTDELGRSIIVCDRRIPTEDFDETIPNHQYKVVCTRPAPVGDSSSALSLEEAEEAQKKQITDAISVLSFGFDSFGRTTITLVSALPSDVAVGAVWGMSNPKLQPQLFRCLGVTDQGKGRYEIAGIEYHPEIFQTVDNDAPYSETPIRYDLDDWKRPVPPTGLALFVVTKNVQDSLSYKMTVSWTPPTGSWLKEYNVYVQRGLANYQFVTTTKNTSVDIELTEPDNYCVRVTGVSQNGGESEPVQACTLIGELSAENREIISGLELANRGNSNIFFTADANFEWRVNWSEATSEFQSGKAPILPPNVREYLVTVYDANRTRLFAGTTKTTAFTFTRELNMSSLGGPHRELILEVKARTTDGALSLPTTLRVLNERPRVPTILSVEADDSGQIVVTIANPSQTPDFGGYRVWVSTKEGFRPNSGTLVFQGQSTSISIPGILGVPNYVRIAEYDLLSNDSGDAELSPEYVVTPTKGGASNALAFLRGM